MMGFQETAARLFYDFCLDGHVPSDHMLRSIGRHLNLDDVRQRLKPFYSSTGRPSIDPELMIRMSPRTPTSSALSRATNGNRRRSRPRTTSRAAPDYLATLDDAAFGAASPVTPKFISPSDPAAQWTGAHKGHAFFAYETNYLIDTDHGVIVDVEATRAIRQAEVSAARTMLERTEVRFGLKGEWLF